MAPLLGLRTGGPISYRHVLGPRTGMPASCLTLLRLAYASAATKLPGISLPAHSCYAGPHVCRCKSKSKVSKNSRKGTQNQKQHAQMHFAKQAKCICKACSSKTKRKTSLLRGFKGGLQGGLGGLEGGLKEGLKGLTGGKGGFKRGLKGSCKKHFATLYSSFCVQLLNLQDACVHGKQNRSCSSCTALSHTGLPTATLCDSELFCPDFGGLSSFNLAGKR